MRMEGNSSKLARFWLLSILAFSLSLSIVFIFPSSISLSALLRGDLSSEELLIFWSLRLPRFLLAFFVGAGLSVAGVIFQASFRNPLASPYTLGVSGGAAFGAAFALQLFSMNWLGHSSFGLSGCALLGAALSMGVLFAGLSFSASLVSESMLLVGVVLNFFWGSLILFLQFLSDQSELFTLSRWFMGNLNVAGFHEVLWVGVTVVCCSAYLLTQGRALDLLSLGAEFAQSRGVSVQIKSAHLIGVASLVTAVVVSFAGPIGFVGIMIPHFVRRLFHLRHFPLLIGSFLLGGAFLALCDSVSRVLLFPIDLPVGILTAFLGAPFFIWILLFQRGYGGKGRPL